MHIKRWCSIWYQINEIIKLKPTTVLEFGPGIGILKSVLQTAKIKYFSADIASDLCPDFMGSVDSLTLDKKFDLVCAFQVLEHLPYEKFESCLKNLSNLSSRYVIISLPYFGPYIKFKFELFPLIDLRFVRKLIFPKSHKFDGEHYWEIGKKNYSLKRVKTDIEKVFKVKNSFLISENPYHYIFVLEKL